jgi:hypothetical protein
MRNSTATMAASLAETAAFQHLQQAGSAAAAARASVVGKVPLLAATMRQCGQQATAV